MQKLIAEALPFIPRSREKKFTIDNNAASMIKGWNMTEGPRAAKLFWMDVEKETGGQSFRRLGIWLDPRR